MAVGGKGGVVSKKGLGEDLKRAVTTEKQANTWQLFLLFYPICCDPQGCSDDIHVPHVSILMAFKCSVPKVCLEGRR